MTMVPASRELLDRYSSSPDSVTWRWESAAVEAILRHGSRHDAVALLPAFLEDPGGRDGLIPVLAEHGDVSTAEQLMAGCTEDGRLRDDAPHAVLNALGYLGYEPAERLLWSYVEQPDPERPYPVFGIAEASLGLLHLPCRGLREQIQEALLRHLGSALFPEFLPVLSVKTGDRSWLGRLVGWGEGAASTDCNGGLILGIALQGGRSRAEFLRMLWNPWWEASGGGTGSDRWAYAGARVLGLTMPELYSSLGERLGSDADEPEKRHCLSTFAALLAHWADRPWVGVHGTFGPAESCDDLYRLLFEWSQPNRDDSLIGLAGQILDRDDPLVARLYELENELRIRAAHELEARTMLHTATGAVGTTS